MDINNPSEQQNKKRSYRYFKNFSLAFLVLFLLLVSFSAGMYMAKTNEVVGQLAEEGAVYAGKVLGKYSEAPSGKLSQDVDFSQFWDVWDLLMENYVDKEKLNEKSMFYGAIKGMVSAVGDPYTVFMDPKISKEFSDDLAGTFEGIGAEIGMKNDGLTIIAPLPDMPAESAGLRAGDKILGIDGEPTTGMSIDEAVSKIRGPKGTQVVLTIYRSGLESPEEIPITRDTIVVKSVRDNLREDGIYAVEISNFNEDTLSLFNETVADIVKQSPRGIILDLRNNPGGYLDTAIEISSEWLDDKIVVVEEFSDDFENPYLSRGRPRLKDFKTVVLVNRGSASASEIVAGALQDHKEAIVVGEQTFGKGSVQSLQDLKDGSSVKITVAKWLTPNGNNISEKGITPDVWVELTEDDYNNDKDPQFEKAVEILNSEDFWSYASTTLQRVEE